MLSIALAFGCSDSSMGASGANGTGAANGMGATGGEGVAAFSGAVLCSLIFGQDGNTGFVRLVSDEELEASEPIDSTAEAIEVSGGVSCAVRGRSVFALNWEGPTITRYDEVGGALVMGETVSFANFGETSLSSEADSRPTVFISDTKAYYLGRFSSQIIVWDPTAMETIGAIPLTLAEPPEGLRLVWNRLAFIDGLVVAYNGYLDDQQVLSPRSDFWFVDAETDEVVATDVTEECGGLLPPTTASNGDLYIGSIATSAMNHALGLPGSFEPCAIRIRTGSREVDTMYRADLNMLTGGLPTAGPVAVTEDRALLVAYDTNSIPIDSNLTSMEHLGLTNWKFYDWELGSEQPATLVESIPTSTGFVDTRGFDGKTFLLRSAPNLTGTELLDLAQRPVATTFTISNLTWLLARLGSEPRSRMAHLLPTTRRHIHRD